MVVKKWFNLSLFLSIALLAVAAFTTLKVLPAQAAGTIVVNSTADDQDNDGECTLREAIIAANTDAVSGAAVGECAAGAGVDTIEFDIAPLDGGVKTIAVDSQLPDVSTEMIIDGYTQDTASPNTAVSPAPFINGSLLIELSGQNIVGPAVTGLNMANGSDNSVIRGLVINRFTSAGISLNPGADGVKVKGNYIGTDPTGLLDRGNVGSGVTTTGTLHGTEGADNVVVGGTLAADRNIISANSSHSNDPNLVIGSQGLAIIGGSDDWVVQGNYIGVGANGTTDLGNELGGMTIDYIDGLLIGGDTPGAGNVVSGNGDGGLQPDGVLNLVVQGNYIGTDYTGASPLPNGTKGMTLAYGTTNALIGGTTPGSGNIIAFNPWFGINVWQVETQNVTIIGNSIHDNGDGPGYGGNVGVGIDLSNQNSEGGMTLNDILDSDTGPNNLLNFPDNVQYVVNSGNTDMSYTLDVPAGQYRVEFFSNTTADASGHGEGETYLGSHDIVKTGSGSQSFAHTLTGATLLNISATATLKDGSTDGFGPTSEFSATATEKPRVTDASITKNLLNPNDVAQGATVDYSLVLTNDGPDSMDLTGLGTVYFGPPLIIDMAPPDLTPTNQLAAGLFPNSFFVDSGNPDLTCLWAGPGSGGLYAGLTSNADYSATYCWYTGLLTELASGSSLSATISFTVANDSSLVFTNYAIAGSTDTDPDAGALGAIFSSGNDVLEMLKASGSSINNFASAAYPLPVEPGVSVSPPSPLAAAGTNEATWILASFGMLTAAAWLATRLRKNASVLH